eukprot:CAMPEP_0196822736 /NCGR_PEP_ID=MMETSP1362-20130617/84540_1 /TAXON_ID=163516 /ORGANISM="Leptocylindrus danicus, Strain CCMP1856" /LENGTH=342 /DNA_ID=CAMNT_0042202369 /DNA_START=222 /DNA_END=1247 /DNA_ORIENTATION=-
MEGSKEAGHVPDHTAKKVSCNHTDGGDCDEVKLISFLRRAGLFPQKNETANISSHISLKSLECGYCNKVYHVELLSKNYVAKIYSDVAKERMLKSANPADVLLSYKSLGPNVLYCDEDGILMNFVDGATLNASDVHGDTSSSFGNGTELCRAIARKVAALHAIGPQPEFNSLFQENMLWFSLERMMSYILRKNACLAFARATGIDEWPFQRLSDEIHEMRNSIEVLNLPQVFGHGDLKPSNIMCSGNLSKDESSSMNNSFDDTVNQIFLIDFEMAGLIYRGFDLYKLFRTNQFTKYTDENMRAFAESYLIYFEQELPRLEGENIEASTVLQLESKVFKPLTW